MVGSRVRFHPRTFPEDHRNLSVLCMCHLCVYSFPVIHCSTLISRLNTRLYRSSRPSPLPTSKSPGRDPLTQPSSTYSLSGPSPDSFVPYGGPPGVTPLSDRHVSDPHRPNCPCTPPLFKVLFSGPHTHHGWFRFGTGAMTRSTWSNWDPFGDS